MTRGKKGKERESEASAQRGRLFLEVAFDVALDGALHLLLKLLGHDTLLNVLEEVRLALQVLPEALLPFDNLLNGHIVEETVDTGKDDRDLHLSG